MSWHWAWLGMNPRQVVYTCLVNFCDSNHLPLRDSFPTSSRPVAVKQIGGMNWRLPRWISEYIIEWLMHLIKKVVFSRHWDESKFKSRGTVQYSLTVARKYNLPVRIVATHGNEKWTFCDSYYSDVFRYSCYSLVNFLQIDWNGCQCYHVVSDCTV